MVAVIDGSQLLLTAFRRAVIPPPMCTYSVKIDDAINSVIFGPIGCNDFIIINNKNQILFCQPQFKNGLFSGVTVAKPRNVDHCTEIPLDSSQWLFAYENIFVVESSQQNSTIMHLYQSFIKKDSLVITKAISRLHYISKTDFLVINVDGSILRIKITVENKEHHKFETQENVINNIEEGDEAIDDVCSFTDQMTGRLKLFTLKQRNRLYLDDRLIATEVTSMLLTDIYLLFTTLDRLHFVRKSDGRIVNDRRMECGGRLVTVVSQDGRTVLQMPRGNLEVIQPRVLSLCIIGDLLDSSEYQRAFTLLRKQRINLNLLFDHNPAKFLSEVDKFIESIDNANWLNLFLSDLENVDVTRTMYVSSYDEAGRDTIPSDKVNVVCERICAVIGAQAKQDQLLLPILTSHVKRNDLEQALRIVWQIKKHDDETATESKSSQDALKYLLYLVHVNELYNVALGMYDFGLVLFVATKSQKDPKEYLPFLNELQKIEDLSYRSYKIDLHLKRWSKALEHISHCGHTRLPEALELIEAQSLYTSAMTLYRNNESCYRGIVHSFAGHLRQKGKFRDACLMYERSCDMAQAILSARHILDWQKCVTLAMAMGQSADQIRQLVS